MGPAAVLLLAVLGWGNAGGGLTPCPHGFIGGGLTPCTQAAPLVEFAGPLNTGMGSVCAGTVPALTNGTAITYSRFGNATCTKTSPSGLALTGIQNGDLVTLSNFQPRVEWATAGQLAYLGEPAATNYVLQSENLAGWNIAASVTVTNNSALSPAGTLTADRVQAPGGASATDRVYQLTSQTAASVISGYFRGTSGSGTVYIWDANSSTSLPAAACSYTSSSWTRCTLSVPADASGVAPAFGCYGTFWQMPATCPAIDVLAWGLQVESLPGPTSYIPTTTATITRAADTAALPANGAALTQGSAAMTYVPVANGASGVYPPQLSFTTTSRMLYGNSPSVGFFDGVNNPLTPAGLTANVAKRYWSTWSTGSGVTVRNVTDGNQATSAFSLGTWVTDSAIELQGIAGVWPSGLVYGICVDPDLSRCR